jgi:hypothetical protein
MPGAWCARSPACSVESTRGSHHGHTGTPGIPYAMVLTVSFVISPVIGLSCHRHPRDAKHHRELDASVEASEPHDFAVRLSAVRYRHLRVHRIPPRVRDDREPPLRWDETAMNKPVIWVWCEEEIFLRRGLDRQIRKLPVGQISTRSSHDRSDMRGRRERRSWISLRFDFRYNARSALGVNDAMRAKPALKVA